MIPSVPFWKMVLKFDKHGLWQIGQILGLSITEYYYIFTLSLPLPISKRVIKKLQQREHKKSMTFWSSTVRALKIN